MNAIVFGFLCLLAMWVLVVVSPTGKPRNPGPSWFEIMPTLTRSQKQKTRLQQKRRHGSRRY